MYARHPHVVERFIVQLEGSETPFLGAAAASARALNCTMGFEPPSWRALAMCEGKSAWARICREAGERVTSNVMVRDLDLPAADTSDNRRLVSCGHHVGVCTAL